MNASDHAATLLNALHVPNDAGEHADALRGMLVRIPDGWGRWISCDRGWYPLLVELDEQLRTLLPDYVVHQVKEKFGGLRYYWESGEEAHDPNDPEPPTPGRDGNEAEWEGWGQAHEAWCERLDAYRQTLEGRGRIADLERRVVQDALPGVRRAGGLRVRGRGSWRSISARAPKYRRLAALQ